MALRLPRFDRSIPVVNEDRTPTLPFHTWWQTTLKAIESAFNQLEDVVDSIQAALDAAGIALAAAEAAQTAADNANAAANGSGAVASLTNSGVANCTITATDAGADATVTISAHDRIYGDGTTVAVGAGSIFNLAYSTYYYIYYDDPERDGLSIIYQATTSDATAAQTGDRHLVGSVTTPPSGGANTDGTRVRPPGVDGLPEEP